MSKTVEFIFDVASPNAYLCHKAIPAIAERTGAQFNYTPCLLGGIFMATGNQAPMLAFAEITGKLQYDHLEMQRFIQRHGLDKFAMNPHFPVNTLLMMRAALVAAEEGYLMKYIDTICNCMWEQGLDMGKGNPDGVAAALSEAGMDGAHLVERAAEQAIKDKLIANTEAAVAKGAFGIPTFYVGGEMFFGKERLGQLEELLA